MQGIDTPDTQWGNTNAVSEDPVEGFPSICRQLLPFASRGKVPKWTDECLISTRTHEA